MSKPSQTPGPKRKGVKLAKVILNDSVRVRPWVGRLDTTIDFAANAKYRNMEGYLLDGDIHIFHDGDEYGLAVFPVSSVQYWVPYANQ